MIKPNRSSVNKSSITGGAPYSSVISAPQSDTVHVFLGTVVSFVRSCYELFTIISMCHDYLGTLI